jgi:hypothetical protein
MKRRVLGVALLLLLSQFSMGCYCCHPLFPRLYYWRHFDGYAGPGCCEPTGMSYYHPPVAPVVDLAAPPLAPVPGGAPPVMKPATPLAQYNRR